MAPRPYSDRASLPSDSANADLVSAIPTQVLADSPSPSTLSAATTPSPPPQEIIITETYVESSENQEDRNFVDLLASTPCYPTPGDVMPYDHSLPDFIRQITNQQNLANLHSLSLRVISTLISLHRMSSYLPNLRELDLRGSVLNSLRDIGCSLKNLQILKVGRCQLESLDGTFGLSSLRELHAEKNLINDVSPCSNLPHIRHIDVSGNRIRNISYAGFLSVCSKLKSIIFAGNPATELPDYRKHVRRILPQIESLDNLPFNNEDEPKPTEIIESFEPEIDNCFRDDDSGSLEQQLGINSDEDLSFLHKKTKDLQNVANQDHFEVLESEKTALELKEKMNHECEQNLEHKIKSEGKRAEQKSISIKKVDKDLENRTKKSISNTKGNKQLENIGSELYEKCLMKNENPPRSQSVDKKIRPSTASNVEVSFYLDDLMESGSSTGALKKRPQTSIPKTRDDQATDFTQGDSKLTTGLPVCGNLTVALRNRKKNQTVWNKNQLQKSSEFESNTNLLIHLDGTGDKNDVERSFESDENLIEEDILETSQKWREAFRRYRSNNRGVWEEENDKTNYSDLLKDSFETNLKFNLSEETQTKSENC